MTRFDYWDDGGLTAAFGRYHRDLSEQYNARAELEQFRAELLADVVKLID